MFTQSMPTSYRTVKYTPLVMTRFPFSLIFFPARALCWPRGVISEVNADLLFLDKDLLYLK